jgi:hypothetical protein
MYVTLFLFLLIVGLKFVVVCCQKTAFHSRLVSALDRYRSDMILPQDGSINDYLKLHFASGKYLQPVAAHVDADRCLSIVLLYLVKFTCVTTT